MKKAGITVAVVAAVALAAFLIYDGIFNKTASLDFAMDTVISAEIIGADSEKCADEIKRLFQLLTRISSQDTPIIQRLPISTKSVVERSVPNSESILEY